MGDYPQLQAIAWQLRADTKLTGIDALQLYERNWRHVDRDAMSDNERALVKRLAEKYSRGVLLSLAALTVCGSPVRSRHSTPNSWPTHAATSGAERR